MTISDDFFPLQTFKFLAVVGIGVARKSWEKSLDIGLTYPTPATIAGNTILLAFLFPHLQGGQRKAE